MVEYSNVRGLVYDNGLKDLDEVCFMVEIERISEQIKSRKGRIAELREEIKALQ